MSAAFMILQHFTNITIKGFKEICILFPAFDLTLLCQTELTRLQAIHLYFGGLSWKRKVN